MARPDDIPQDVWDAAEKAQDAAERECIGKKYLYGFGTGHAKETLDLHIARAILAERERCAKIASGWATEVDGQDKYEMGRARGASLIWQAIRGGR